ncbi:MAG: hypothetical protein EZS28_032086 [Streblomastix strix]|uniref:NrS-1 polymerase-like helicase domain-containing protein n=1 Tax=Streblomastix strix TaxID=222440 RepID=A0A5J4UPT3_9EUKA|nr:MAG: hypothetical protein EZS28_032086 [Streblomastix strix]
MKHLANLRDILDKWNVDIEMSQAEYEKQRTERIYNQQINDDGTVDSMPNDIAQACIDELKNLTIHNYPQAINMEVSFLSIFSGLYGISNESNKTEGINNIRKFNKLTVNAEKNYGQAASNGERKPNAWILIKILRYHNKDYYQQIIQPLLKKNYELKKQQKVTNVLKSIEKCEIDLKDPFTLKNILDKSSNGEYANKIELVAQDLQKILKVAPCQNGSCYIIKEYDCINDTNVIHYKNKQAIYDQLRAIKLWQDGKKNITVVDAFEQFQSLFYKTRIKFISQNPLIFNVFQGYKYKQVDEIDQSKIEQFLRLVKDTIAANDDKIYEYLPNWYAYIVQNTVKKTETAVILQGLQGIGKNVYTNVLCELLAGYSATNITDIDEFVGNFNSVIENKMLAVPNEFKNCGEQRTSNMDATKSIITEGSFRINEKYVPRHEAENVVNLIIVTNNLFPIKIENSDSNIGWENVDELDHNHLHNNHQASLSVEQQYICVDFTDTNRIGVLLQEIQLEFSPVLFIVDGSGEGIMGICTNILYKAPSACELTREHGRFHSQMKQQKGNGISADNTGREICIQLEELPLDSLPIFRPVVRSPTIDETLTKSLTNVLDHLAEQMSVFLGGPLTLQREWKQLLPISQILQLLQLKTIEVKIELSLKILIWNSISIDAYIRTVDIHWINLKLCQLKGMIQLDFELQHLSDEWNTQILQRIRHGVLVMGVAWSGKTKPQQQLRYQCCNEQMV